MEQPPHWDLLMRIVQGAEYLDNPLIRAKEYEKGRRLYDQLCDEYLCLKEVEKKASRGTDS